MVVDLTLMSTSLRKDLVAEGLTVDFQEPKGTRRKNQNLT